MYKLRPANNIKHFYWLRKYGYIMSCVHDMARNPQMILLSEQGAPVSLRGVKRPACCSRSQTMAIDLRIAWFTLPKASPLPITKPCEPCQHRRHQPNSQQHFGKPDLHTWSPAANSQYTRLHDSICHKPVKLSYSAEETSLRVRYKSVHQTSH